MSCVFENEKFIKMLSDKRQRDLLVEFDVVCLSFSRRVTESLKKSNETEFFEVVSKLVLSDGNSVVFNNTEIRLNVFNFTEPGSTNSEPVKFFSFRLLEEWLEQVESDKEIIDWLEDGVTILDI
jgi:hypothetical protein